MQQYLADYFGDQSPYPPLARPAYPFKKAALTASTQRRQAWDRALAANQTGKLADAARAFEQLTAEDAQDAAAWYNLSLVRAWLGDNRKALEALDQYVTIEPEEEPAAAAWALGEVLRFAAGMQEVSDYVEHRVIYPMRDVRAIATALSKDRRLVEVRQGETGIGGVLLEWEMPAVHENLALFELPHVACLLIITGNHLLLLNSDPVLLEKGRQIVQELFGAALGDPQFETQIPQFAQPLHYLLSIRLPAGVTNEQAKRLLDQHFQQVIEEEWTRRPLKSLNQITPVDAAGHAGLRKKLLGVILFMEDVAKSLVPLPYDFDRLRHKLGLPTRGKPPESTAGAKADIPAMNAAELATLQVEGLSEPELHQAFQTALRLDADELAGRFAQTLVERPPQTDRPDRYAYYNHLVQLALDRQDSSAAHWALDAGLKHDCEHNEGRRRNEYELRRAQVHLSAGEPEIAQDVFTRLVQRVPSDLDLLGKATEAMLSAKRLGDAATFAEQGLKTARQKGDRDRVGYFEELLAAARR
jgi:tetratricopeptide (TPR) repeat protein